MLAWHAFFSQHLVNAREAPNISEYCAFPTSELWPNIQLKLLHLKAILISQLVWSFDSSDSVWAHSCGSRNCLLASKPQITQFGKLSRSRQSSSTSFLASLASLAPYRPMRATFWIQIKLSKKFASQVWLSRLQAPSCGPRTWSKQIDTTDMQVWLPISLSLPLLVKQ